MTALLRTASPALATALANGVRLWSADIYDITTADGGATFHWTSWDTDLVVGGVTYASKNPWLSRSAWDVANTMKVPGLTVKVMALDGAFNGGANFKAQVHNGLLDGAAFTLQRVFMTSPGNVTALGAVALFGGEVGQVSLTGSTATLEIKGKTNKLDQFAPRNLYQVGCNHAFCDPGCTLSRATYTAAFTLGATPAPTFLPWSGSPPGNATNYQGGTVKITSGAASGQSRTVSKADSTGLTLAYPLYQTPSAGDTITAFQGCDKSFNSGSGQSCTDRSNTQHYRGYEFVPPPSSAY